MNNKSHGDFNGWPDTVPQDEWSVISGVERKPGIMRRIAGTLRFILAELRKVWRGDDVALDGAEQ